MKLLHIITGLNDGGAEAVLSRLAMYDTANQHVVISMMDYGKYGFILKDAGITVYCLKMKPGRVSIKGIIRLLKVIYTIKPDVVQTWMYHADLVGGIFSRLIGIKSVVWGIRHTTFEAGKSKKNTIIIAHILACLSRWVPKRIAVCAKKAIEVHGVMGYDTSRMHFIPNGYDLSDFKPDSTLRVNFKESIGIDDSKPLLGMVGRFNPQKDYETLLKALNILQERGFSFIFVLVGTGLDKSNKELIQLLERYELTSIVRLLGRRSDIPKVMNALDLHVLSSSYGEAFPNVIAEAMACGTPSVTTDVGDAALIVGNTGWVVPPSNPIALADAVQNALSARNQPNWSERCILARRRIEENFSMQHMVASYRKIWEEAIIKK